MFNFSGHFVNNLPAVFLRGGWNWNLLLKYPSEDTWWWWDWGLMCGWFVDLKRCRSNDRTTRCPRTSAWRSPIAEHKGLIILKAKNCNSLLIYWCHLSYHSISFIITPLKLFSTTSSWPNLVIHLQFHTSIQCHSRFTWGLF